jgi:hypothetical protein
MRSEILLTAAILTAAHAFCQIRVDKVMVDQPVFGYIDEAHTSEINRTRASAESPLLKRDPQLDSLALDRCLRYSKFIIGDIRYINDVAFIKKEIHNGFSGLFRSENSTDHLFGAGFTDKQFSQLTPSMVLPKICATKYNPGNEYNNSEGHYRNRINKNWKRFGSATVVIFIKIKNPDYNPNSPSLEYIPQAIFLNYEVFS